MSDRSLLIFIAILVLIETVLIIEGFKDVNGREEYLSIAAFIAGGGAMWAVSKGSKK